MPKITIDLTDKAVAGLTAERDRYNAANGASLTLGEWVHRVLSEIAVAQQLAHTTAALTEQHQRDAQAALNAAITAARDQLVTTLDAQEG